MNAMTTRTTKDVAYERLVEQAARLRENGRHVDVNPSHLLAEIRVLADAQIVAAIENDQHEGRWIADPEVNNVWGWQPSSYADRYGEGFGFGARRVALVYYRALADFECDADWERDYVWSRTR